MSNPTLGTGYEPAQPGPAQPGPDGGWTSYRTIDSFVDFTLRKLRRNELAVWLVLWRLGDVRTGVVCVSYAVIAERAGCGVATVKRAVKWLKAAGLVEVVWQGGFRRGASRFRVRGIIPG